MAKLKSKTVAETVAAPRDGVEAAGMIARIGDAMREQQLIQVALNEQLAREREKAEELARPHDETVRTLTRAVQLWAEANRATLTDNGKTKTVVLATGRITWRIRPPSVRIASAKAVMIALNALGLDRFLRTKIEPNKEAMLAEPDVASAVPGITIASAGEDFAIEPDGIELSGSPA